MKLRAIISTALVAGILGLAVLGAKLMISLRSKPEPTEPTKAVARVVAPEIAARHNYRMAIEGFGSTRAAVEVQIVPEVLGKVVWRSPDAFSGRFVTEGQELFRIEREDYDLAKQSADHRVALLAAQEAALDQEEKNLDESKKIEAARVAVSRKILNDTRKLGGAASVGEVDRAEQAYLTSQSLMQNLVSQLALVPSRRLQIQADQRMARVQLDQAVLDRDRTTYTSPVAGRIRTWQVPVDQVLQAGRTYGEIYATGVMEVPVPVAAEDLQWIDVSALARSDRAAKKRIPAEVTWHGSGIDARTWQGYVDRVEAGLTARTRTAVLVVRVDNKPDDPAGMLDINMFCRVRISGKSVASVFVIPRNAVGPDGNVYLAVDGKLRRRKVKVIRFTADEALVLPGGGLAEGDRVVTSYLAAPVIGMPVTPLDAAAGASAGKAASRPAAGR